MQPLDAVAPLADHPSKVEKGKPRGTGMPRLTDFGSSATEDAVAGGRFCFRLSRCDDDVEE